VTPSRALLRGALAGVRVTPLPKGQQRTASLVQEEDLHDCPLRAVAFEHGGAGPSEGIPRLLACRVDALVVAFKLDLDPAIRDELGERQAVADESGRAALRVGAASYELKRSRRQHVIGFRNAELRGVYDPIAQGGWVLEIVVLAVYLMSHTLEEALALAERVSLEFGTVREARLRRFDLCADFQSFGFRDDDAADRILTTRARFGSFVADTKDIDEAAGSLCKSDIREYRTATRTVTGIAVAAGNPLMARLYDKTAELRLSGREHKRALEHDAWRISGWDGLSSVTRVEFQHRGRVLDEMCLRDPRMLPTKLDEVWQRDTRWLRLIDPDSATRRKRCALDPRWQVVIATTFRHVAMPITRARLRGDGAQPAHVLGVVRSMLGARERLTWASVNDDGELVPESSFADGMPPAEQEAWLRRYYERLSHDSGRVIANDELSRYGARGALIRAVAQNDATIARFSGSPGETLASQKRRDAFVR
jgi:hypothetical protein